MRFKKFTTIIRAGLAVATLFLMSNQSLFAQVDGKIGNNPGNKAASAVLELESTTKGFLLPRMTAAQMNAISSPANGLAIYNTDIQCTFLYRGSTWVSLCDSATNGLTKSGSVISLGGALTGATTITSSASNTLAIDGLQGGAATDSIMTLVGSTGVLRRRTVADVLAGSGNVWLVGGNTLTTAGTVGSNSNHDFGVITNGITRLTFSSAGAITQTGTGQVTFTGNVDATNGLDVTTAQLTANAGSTLTGTTNVNATGAGATNIGNASSATTVLGATTINTTGTAATSIGNAASTVTVAGTTSVTGATTINTTGAVTVSGAVGTDIGTVTVTNSGGTSFNGTVDAATIALTATTGTIAFTQNTNATTAMTAAAGAYNVSLTGTLVIAFGAAMVGSLFSSDAWNNVTFAAAEVKDPQKNLPLALMFGTGLVSLLYVLANVGYLQALPMHGESLEDAMRLLYVAMTRATRELVLSAHAHSGVTGLVRQALDAVQRQFGTRAGQTKDGGENARMSRKPSKGGA